MHALSFYIMYLYSGAAEQGSGKHHQTLLIPAPATKAYET